MKKLDVQLSCISFDKHTRNIEIKDKKNQDIKIAPEYRS